MRRSFIYPLGFVFSISLTAWNGVTPPQFGACRTSSTWLSTAPFDCPCATTSSGLSPSGCSADLPRRPGGHDPDPQARRLAGAAHDLLPAQRDLPGGHRHALDGHLQRRPRGPQPDTHLGSVWNSWTHNWLGEIETALPAVIAQQVLYIGYFMIIILAGHHGHTRSPSTKPPKSTGPMSGSRSCTSPCPWCGGSDHRHDPGHGLRDAPFRGDLPDDRGGSGQLHLGRWA